MAVAKAVNTLCRTRDGYPRKASAPVPKLLSEVVTRWVAAIPRAAEGTRKTANTIADNPTMDLGFKRIALTAPSRMSPSCRGLSGTIPGLCQVNTGVCGYAIAPAAEGAAAGWSRGGSRSCGPGAGKSPVAVICLPVPSGIGASRPRLATYGLVDRTSSRQSVAERLLARGHVQLRRRRGTRRWDGIPLREVPHGQLALGTLDPQQECLSVSRDIDLGVVGFGCQEVGGDPVDLGLDNCGAQLARCRRKDLVQQPADGGGTCRCCGCRREQGVLAGERLGDRRRVVLGPVGRVGLAVALASHREHLHDAGAVVDDHEVVLAGDVTGDVNLGCHLFAGATGTVLDRALDTYALGRRAVYPRSLE